MRHLYNILLSLITIFDSNSIGRCPFTISIFSEVSVFLNIMAIALVLDILMLESHTHTQVKIPCLFIFPILQYEIAFELRNPM